MEGCDGAAGIALSSLSETYIPTAANAVMAREICKRVLAGRTGRASGQRIVQTRSKTGTDLATTAATSATLPTGVLASWVSILEPWRENAKSSNGVARRSRSPRPLLEAMFTGLVRPASHSQAIIHLNMDGARSSTWAPCHPSSKTKADARSSSPTLRLYSMTAISATLLL